MSEADEAAAAVEAVDAANAVGTKLVSGDISKAEADRILSVIEQVAISGSDVDLDTRRVPPPKNTNPFKVPASLQANASTSMMSMNESSDRSQSVHSRPPRTKINVNIPENIIFAVDLTESIDQKCVGSKSAQAVTVLQAIQQALAIFAHSKSRMNKYHKFGLFVMGEGLLCLLEPTSDPTVIAEMVRTLVSQGQFGPLNLNTLLDEIAKKCNIEPLRRPEQVLRVILLHARQSPPIYNDVVDSLSSELLKCPGFYIDFVGIYNQKSGGDSANGFLQFCNDEFPNPHFYRSKVPNSARAIMGSITMLMAHPLQRMDQLSVCHSLDQMQADLL